MIYQLPLVVAAAKGLAAGQQKRQRDTKEMRRLKQMIRRKMIQKVKPSAKVYNRKKQ